MSPIPKPIVLIVGRLSGPKNRVTLAYLREVASAVAHQVPGIRFQVVGGPVGDEHRQLQAQFPFLRFEGHQKDLLPFYRKADVVVGAGRVALEAMVLGKPVVAVGEKLYVGPLSPPNLEEAQKTNFGDCFASDHFDWARATRDLLGLLSSKAQRDRTAKTGRSLLLSHYSMDRIYPQTEALYERVLLENNLAKFQEIPVLMYHRVVPGDLPGSKFGVHITKANLEKHLQFLRVRRFTPITFSDLCQRRVPEKPVILTFDDGYQDNHRNLLPLLERYKMKAVVYVLGNRKHRNNYWDIPQGEPEAALLNGQEIKEMDRTGLVEFGSHAMDHERLTRWRPAQAREQIVRSRKVLGDLLGKPVLSLAYPYGDNNENIQRMTAEAGYRFGVAVQSPHALFSENLMAIRRVHMFPHSTVFDLWKKTTGFYHRYRKWTGRFDAA